MFRERIGWFTSLSLIMFFSLVHVSQAQLHADIDDRGAADSANTKLGFEQFLIGGADDEQATTKRTLRCGLPVAVGMDRPDGRLSTALKPDVLRKGSSSALGELLIGCAGTFPGFVA